MKMELKSLIEWSILLAILLVLVYTAITIKNEKKVFFDSLKPYYLKDFIFKIPSWWGLEKDLVSPTKASFV